MKVLHLYKDFDPHGAGGGVARHIHGVATVLHTRDFEMRVAAPGARVDRISYQAIPATWLDLFRLIREVDVVHLHGARTPWSAWGGLIAILMGRPTLYTPHCYYPSKGLMGRSAKRLWDAVVERSLIHCAEAYILLDFSWVEAVRDLGLPSDRARIIPNCVHGEKWYRTSDELPDTKKERPLRLIQVGRLDPVKRVEDSLRVLTEPGLRSAVLDVVGKGPDEARLKEVASALGAAARVHFHGALSDEALRSLMARAHALLLPSEQEGLPTVLIEAVLFGLPVVCTQIPGNLAVVRGLESAALHAVGDITEMGKGILRVAGMGVPIKDQVEIRQRLTWEVKGEELGRAYQRAFATEGK